MGMPWPERSREVLRICEQMRGYVRNYPATLPHDVLEMSPEGKSQILSAGEILACAAQARRSAADLP